MGLEYVESLRCGCHHIFSHWAGIATATEYDGYRESDLLRGQHLLVSEDIEYSRCE